MVWQHMVILKRCKFHPIQSSNNHDCKIDFYTYVNKTPNMKYTYDIQCSKYKQSFKSVNLMVHDYVNKQLTV